MEKLGSNISKIILVFSIILYSCNSQNIFKKYIEKNNRSHIYDHKLVNNPCFQSKVIIKKGLEYRYFIQNNETRCVGIRTVGSKNDYFSIIESSDTLNLQSYIKEFKKFLDKINTDDIHKVDILFFTNIHKSDLTSVSKWVPIFTKMFYEKIIKKEFIPLNFIIIYNADTMIKSFKNIPSVPPPSN